MADVRLTATNPEDSSVVPVACDASGRLLLEEQRQGPPGPEGPPGPKGDEGKDGKDGDPFSGNFAGDVTFGGSATFASSITTGTYDHTSDTTQGSRVGVGAIRAQRRADQADPNTQATYSSYLGSVPKFQVFADGSAKFADGKAGFTAEGYLWCTTRRGDTVILDATSNGLGSWVEYTPTTSRIDALRDRLDANRPGTGEMPADTP